MFEVHADLRKNRLYLTLKHNMDMVEFMEFSKKALVEAQKLKNGFGVLTDLSEMAILTEDTRVLLQEFIKKLQALGLGNVVRVVNPQNPLVSLQWQRTSWKLGYTAEITPTIWLAEQKLDELDHKLAFFMDSASV